MVFGNYPRIVRREPGPQTMTGAGDTVVDSNGDCWRVISNAEANFLRNGTGNSVATIHSDGTIR